VHVDGARVLGIRQPDEELAGEPQRLDDLLADERAIVRLREGLDQDRGHPVRGAPVIDDARSWRPLQREAADRSPQQVVVRPRLLGDVGVGKSALMREQLDDGEIALPVGLEARHVLRHAVGVAQRPPFREEPHGARRDDLRVRVHEPERVLARGHARGLEASVAEGPEERELSPARDGDLRARIPAFGQMAGDDLAEPLERLRIEAHILWTARREWNGHRRSPSSEWSSRRTAGV
jgi:hypothetical protein